MDPILVSNAHSTFLEFPAGSIFIARERDALDLVGLCGEHGATNVLLDGSCLADTFFDLKTGLAGDVLLKLSNYFIRAAVVTTEDRIGTGKFSEFVLETNRGKQFGVFTTREAAASWLGHS